MVLLLCAKLILRSRSLLNFCEYGLQSKFYPPALSILGFDVVFVQTKVFQVPSLVNYASCHILNSNNEQPNNERGSCSWIFKNSDPISIWLLCGFLDSIIWWFKFFGAICKLIFRSKNEDRLNEGGFSSILHYFSTQLCFKSSRKLKPLPLWNDMAMFFAHRLQVLDLTKIRKESESFEVHHFN